MTNTEPKTRKDGQMTGLAGEFFVAAELLKRGLQTSVTFGNAKAIDLLAYNPKTKRSFTVQVKSLREKNYFLIAHGNVKENHIYVFVLLNKPEHPVEYFIVPGIDLRNEPDKFKYLLIEKMPGVHPNELEKFNYKNAWHHFETGAP